MNWRQPKLFAVQSIHPIDPSSKRIERRKLEKECEFPAALLAVTAVKEKAPIQTTMTRHNNTHC